MENKPRMPDKLHVPKRTTIAIKKTSLMLDELELRREKEAEFKLTPYEKDQYLQLKAIFASQRPAEKIENAIEDEKRLKQARKEFLAASKTEKEKQEIKEKADKDSLGGLLLAAGTPVVLIGVTLLDTFMTAGVGVIAAGAAMYVPAFVREVTKKRKARKELRKIKNKVDKLSYEIDEKSRNVDKVCGTYGIPINCLEKQKYMIPLLDAAKEYERLQQKEVDDRDEIMQHLTEIIMTKISEYQDEKCAFWAYIHNSIKYESANHLLKMKSSLSGASPDMIRKSKRIVGYQKENHLSDEELMEKYGIKKKKTLSKYRRLANFVESLDEEDDKGKNMYDRLGVKYQKEQDEDDDFKEIPDPDIKILRNYSREEQIIIKIYHDVIRDEKTKKAWKRETQKRCREYDIPGNKVADTLRRYQNELYKEKT